VLIRTDQARRSTTRQLAMGFMGVPLMMTTQSAPQVQGVSYNDVFM